MRCVSQNDAIAIKASYAFVFGHLRHPLGSYLYVGKLLFSVTCLTCECEDFGQWLGIVRK